MLREYMEEIKKLKMMLEGQTAFNPAVLGNLPPGLDSIQEKIIYKERENK